MCPVGIPSTHTYYKWQHKSKYGVLIHELDGRTNGVLTLPSIPVEDTYQDSGEYVCIVGNGILGRYGNIKHRIWLCHNKRYVKQTVCGCIIMKGMQNRQDMIMS